MLPSRLTKRVREQDWAALVLEIVIVVIGVFLGLEAANWNQDRQDRERTESYVERLEADLEAELTIWQDFLQYFSTTREHAQSALNGFVTPAEELDQDFLIDLYQASQERNLSTRRATYDELVSTGGLEYLSNQEVRAALGIHYDLSLRREDFMAQVTDYREVLRSNMDHRIQDAIVLACGDQDLPHPSGYVGVELPEHCSIDLPAELIDSEVQRLHNSTPILQALRFQTSVLGSRLRILENAVEETATTLDAVRGLAN